MPDPYDTPLHALAHGISLGPDGQDWNDALAWAPEVMEEIEERGYVVLKTDIVRTLLATIDLVDAVNWGHGCSWDIAAEAVGFTPVGPADSEAPR